MDTHQPALAIADPSATKSKSSTYSSSESVSSAPWPKARHHATPATASMYASTTTNAGSSRAHWCFTRLWKVVVRYTRFGSTHSCSICHSTYSTSSDDGLSSRRP